jgi:hypothetical protein
METKGAGLKLRMKAKTKAIPVNRPLWPAGLGDGKGLKLLDIHQRNIRNSLLTMCWFRVCSTRETHRRYTGSQYGRKPDCRAVATLDRH